MCIIYTRPAGVTLPKEDFMNAVKNNPHGWGVAIPDGKGNLRVIRELWDEPDAEGLYSFLHDEAAESQFQLHLRYTTAGGTSFRNLHPFPVLEKSKDGVDMRMAHNGTIHKFKHTANSDMKWESDTRHFVRTYVRPLFKRLILGMEPEDLLTDPFIEGILSDLIPGSSVLSFIDGYGNTLEVNAKGNGGDYYDDGWWCSNKYSFNPTHRTSSTTHRSATHGNGGVYRHGQGGTGSQNTWNDDYYDGWMWRSRSQDTKQYTKEEHALDTQQEKFSKKFDVDDVNDLFDLTDDTLQMLADDSPEDLLLLTKELLHECLCLKKMMAAMEDKHEKAIRSLKKANDNQKSTIEQQREEIGILKQQGSGDEGAQDGKAA